MARTLSPEIEAAIGRTAQRTGVDPATLRTFVLIESGGNPNNQTGSYRGLLQLSPGEFAKNGGKGQDIYDPEANLTAGALKLKSESRDFAKRFGREPTASELYMMHQQGVGGSMAHWTNPDAPAWENMASTAEGQQRGKAWAKQAIWGNVPDDVKAKFGSVDNITSKDFVGLWDNKVARIGGNPVSPSPDMPKAARVASADPWPFEEPAKSAPPLPPAAGPSGIGPVASAHAQAPAPFSLAGAFNALSGEQPKASGDGSPALGATEQAGFFGSLAGGGGMGIQAVNAAIADERTNAAENPFALLPGVQRRPVDLVRLASILQNRQRLGTA